MARRPGPGARADRSRSRTFFLIVLLPLSIASAACDRAGEFGRDRARDLIRRELLGGREEFEIRAPHAYQYGSVHVDGPAGGMLYRFEASPAAVSWIIELKGLRETEAVTASGSLLDFLEDAPRWWNPRELGAPESYSRSEAPAGGGQRLFLIIHHRRAGVVHAVEHYSRMGGVRERPPPGASPRLARRACISPPR